MEVTIVDSEPSIVALIDCLDRLPTQPPSLYLDIEGVKLCRHGSISILQLFVLPKNHVFLIDMFVLQGKAFCTSNRSGTDLRSILESALVPKVFFDVRNDSDALFAHFQISMQGVQDVQLLEVATRSFSKERVSGLAKCIEQDAQLTVEAIAVWKAAKQKGLSLFSPEHGGSYEVFNARPMLQDIVDYCTQDVVYLPVLWNVYNRKISSKWMKKVRSETCERIRVSQTASYEPHGKDKSLSPWANPSKSGQSERPSNSGTAGPGKKTMTSVGQIAATEAAKKIMTTQPEAKPKSQPSVGETDLRRSTRLAALEAAQKAPEITADLERPVSKTELPFRSKNKGGGSQKKPDPTLHPAMVDSKWRCITCNREMQEDQKEEHLAGKQHIARVKRAATAASETARQTSASKKKTVQATTGTMRSLQTGNIPSEAKPRKTKPAKAADTRTKGRKRQTAVPGPQQRGLPYPPDHHFVGFGGSSYVPRGVRYETPLPWGDEDYAICDKDCGWCGHCMDGVDI